ncbi:hypothetical protein FOQG_08743 [Fusarium oxysporum f. sp. raphani 54005]|uniref:Uncharacterized protein n=8 Tax=Fusarium oxysporum TaxID=5507 RepID=W9IPR9_FUSOX|nr:hypothetical protein FOXG_19143 [Fusarium oxysporum f. sp. lycopersici 4287]EWY95320.1 hypothetical protein FOYG_04395 [Fusarium oxysporum NRRL 32931]EWZ42887.1 hypothetical protein FOZG_07676 [Fusarium oxysporum Fo47]EXA00031.1 hypothetical protein FOWG_00374 [Fusarium oxysporum f. sp. lycopersici MN25]EXA46844.1 hypothetical protein FOVG_04145 [Fusarium oxysporum f. sp. pisi HDV247]EXK32999.1 hypothetical protein FOMG_11806 [Fusarium oxysporum f. sp. melonis 26406]EXK87856.1 hypothetical
MNETGKDHKMPPPTSEPPELLEWSGWGARAYQLSLEAIACH